MDDLISRQAAIDAIIAKLDAIDHVPQWVFDELTGVISELPFVQPEITNEEIRLALKQLKTYMLIKIRDKKDGDVPVELLQRIEEIQEYVGNLPSAQPEPHYDEWCTDCKEYDQERHCCPRWNKVIRETLKDLKPEIIRCRDCKHFIKDHGWNRIEYTVCSISPIHKVIRQPDDFCSRGVRRTDEQTDE